MFDDLIISIIRYDIRKLARYMSNITPIILYKIPFTVMKVKKHFSYRGIFQNCIFINIFSVLNSLAFCGDPGYPQRGYAEGTVFTYGSVVTFRCHYSGESPDSARTTTCQSDSTWSNPTPTSC
jgi:hypothetical protein